MELPPNLKGCIAAERAELSAENRLANRRAEPANTPIVEQAREGAVSAPMALVFER